MSRARDPLGFLLDKVVDKELTPQAFFLILFILGERNGVGWVGFHPLKEKIGWSDYLMKKYTDELVEVNLLDWCTEYPAEGFKLSKFGAWLLCIDTNDDTSRSSHYKDPSYEVENIPSRLLLLVSLGKMSRECEIVWLHGSRNRSGLAEQRKIREETGFSSEDLKKYIGELVTFGFFIPIEETNLIQEGAFKLDYNPDLSEWLGRRLSSVGTSTLTDEEIWEEFF